MSSQLFNLTKSLVRSITLMIVSVKKLLSSFYVFGSVKKEDYGDLNYTGDLPLEIPQAYGEDLDYLGYQFQIDRILGESDEDYRARIKLLSTINSTTQSIENSFLDFFTSKYGSGFKVKVLENHENTFTGYDVFSKPLRSQNTFLCGIIVVITYEGNQNLPLSKIQNLLSGLKSKISASGINLEKIVIKTSDSLSDNGVILG